ncbi:hypothetical protein FJZ48_03765 [Candidatus Uhrbacteria bacterium]|nr:hypothetical protein [Candidatus Uhrbacteria bacterium]
MNRAFVMTMKRPHETLGLPIPIGRKLAGLGKSTWITLTICLTIAAAGLYIYQVNSAATKSFTVRDLEKQTERLRNDVMALEDQSVKMQALHQLQERVKPLGYVAIDKMEFIDVSHSAYALAE